MTEPELTALRPLALGHDQDASACHWAQLTRRTADYPSRRAQLAIAALQGRLTPEPGLVELLYRCDDCGRCRLGSILPQPPDLARALWPARAWLVEQGAVPEAEALRERLAQAGHIYGDLRPALDALGPGDPGAQCLFVPDGAVLAHDPEAARAALRAARATFGQVAILPELLDSGRVLLELGLAAEAGRIQSGVRRRIAEAGYGQVVAGTPKEAQGLAETLAGLPVRVEYAGMAFARAALVRDVRLRLGASGGRRVVLHPSAALPHTDPEFGVIPKWLGRWLDEAFCPEPDALRSAWPAAVERPPIGLPDGLAAELARRRLQQLAGLQPELILTCDPYSRRALRAAAPAGIQVVDLLAFAAPHLEEAGP